MNLVANHRKVHVHSKYNWGELPEGLEGLQWVDKTETDVLLCLVIDAEIHHFRGCDASDIAVAVLFEPPEIQPEIRASVLRNAFRYKLVLTYDWVLLAALPRKALSFPVGGSYLRAAETENLPPKVDGVSISVSAKKRTAGHMLRHQVVAELAEASKIKVMGGSVVPYDSWGSPYRDFRYNIAIENSSHVNYFTEKLLHPILMGTVPVYFGSRSLPKEFEEDGIVRFKSLDGLRRVLPRLDEGFFNTLSKARKKNQLAAKKYMDSRVNINRVILKWLEG